MTTDDESLEHSKTYIADSEQVKILSILHYVMSGLQLFGAVSGMVFLMMGAVFASGQLPANNSNEQAAMQLFGTLFLIIGSIVVLLNLATESALLYAGYSLGQWRNRTYCIVIAVIECISFPLGTLLRVFTIIVPRRETVKERCDANAAANE
jgi:hypothetical protein